ncbi:hypothetical protein HRR83_009384 [Exophiala dermatitidis]|uniref:Mitochondrial carrier protein PET8 n=2 Tax=Exophiala dermatitidis TaxID=5970 RepID=H6BLZ6_EXODN|nr:uncharacterized protein HMPREF1120_01134 [Exophiala dermatitidis NIH/UT8656]KAJ4502897.1 hypothetical protein HRR73_009326 [Exophiala dermatitidis]EHY52932.1 hypothetical protein HMPREF1120_01134 [Exophiala dermatitidis NIH/UT8656]KAJ4512261.1 hypothetical protein HRR75_005161 [Exophiala dermatitidis]KAJ4515167.1 hypothetical protein HRR74_005632 [Exophiala dermatitidis]KAJ4536215.1 hypothetical protein HRR78_008563 [Exophiala dermatitidis]
MSYLARTVTPLRTVGRAFPSRSVAAFHTSSARAALSEDHVHREDRDKDIDHHKRDSVEKAKTGKGEWKPELASQTEQIIQGDRSNLTIEEMQKLGARKSEDDKSPAGSSSSTGSHKQ